MKQKQLFAQLDPGTEGRPYAKSHPWLTFRVSMSEASPDIWSLLGEAQSKCEHIASIPLRPDVAKKLHYLYLAKGAQATTAIEGNTLTEVEAAQWVEGELDLPPSREYLGQELDNVIKAFNSLLDRLRGGDDLSITPELLNNFNASVLDGLDLPDENVVPGQIRGHEVGVGTYKCAPASDCEFLVKKFCAWMDSGDFVAPEGKGIIAGLIKAIIAHVYFVWIHPYGDGNGRTARLIETLVLLDVGVPVPATQLLSNHYNKTRNQYYKELEKTSATGGDLMSFMKYALQGFVDQLKEQLDEIRLQQWQVTWVNYIHDAFRAAKSDSIASHRQRRLLIDMETVDGLVNKKNIRTLTPRLAAAYAGKSQKTVTRDINALDKLGLIEKLPNGDLRSRRELVLAFLPDRKISD